MQKKYRFNKPDYAVGENEKLYNDMVHFEITSLMIGNPRHTGKLDENPDFFSVPAEWVKRK